jgi:hypothetical protein
LPAESSWVDTLSFKLGFNLAPILAVDPGTIQTFSLVYQPDKVTYNQASSENYTAHRVNTTLKGRSGDVTFSFDNTFLYNDGNRLAPTYALNQLSGADANQNDKYRSSLAHAPARERRNQDQDRFNGCLQFDTKYVFVRPISSLTDYNMNTYLFNTSLAPYKGYQDYADRYDLNAGADLGLKIAANWALTLGYRDGYQYQQQFTEAINSDQHYSSNHYQRVLIGLEGKLDWLNVKLAAGPDYRDYNLDAPVNELKVTRYYGEALVTANLPQNQSLTFTYKQWMFVSSTGLVPYDDISYSLVYHWSATKQLGFDLGAKFVEHNYTMGDDTAGSAPSLREDVDYAGLGGISYVIIPHLTASVTYNYDDGQNALSTLPAKYAPSYRFFRQGVFGVGLQYAF